VEGLSIVWLEASQCLLCMRQSSSGCILRTETLG
jgi:hypothetical protein